MNWQYDKQEGWSNKEANKWTEVEQGEAENGEGGQKQLGQQPMGGKGGEDTEYWGAKKDYWRTEKPQGEEWTSRGVWQNWKYREMQGEQRAKTEDICTRQYG